MRTIRASEIGAYLYCQRAWYYQRSGVASQNAADLAAGADLHYRHGRAVLRFGLLRLAAYGLLLLALVLIALYFTNQLL